MGEVIDFRAYKEFKSKVPMCCNAGCLKTADICIEFEADKKGSRFFCSQHVPSDKAMRLLSK